MSLTISLTPAQVEERFEKLRIPGRFTLQEKQSYSTAPAVSSNYPLFGFPIPSENSDLTLSKIKELVGIDPKHQPAFFDHPWYAGQPFMEVPCPPGWHFISSDVLPETIGQPLNYASRFKSGGLELPLAIEVVLMLFLHYADSGEQLLFRKHTWCADSAGIGNVTAGAFGRNGLFLSVHPEGFASRGLGICGKIRVP
jgi:hypothetical protein